MRDFFHRHTFRNCLLAVTLAGSTPAFAQPLAGSYTINAAQATGGTNFISFSDAVNSLAVNGISAPVVFNVTPGTYTEQVIIPEISTASASNTITFNGEGAALQYTSVNTNQRAVLKLDGADYITISGLNITGTGNTASEYGYGIQLINGADYNTITGCNISVSTASSASIINNFAGILVNSVPDAVSGQGNAKCNYNIIAANTVKGGYYGIALVANGSTSMINGNQIRNNSIQDFFRSGVYLDGNNGTIVSGNDISRPNINSGLFWGVSLYNGNTDVQVTTNKIHDPFSVTNSNSGAFGFYLYNATGTAGHENIFANNLVYNFNSYGITEGADLNTSSSYNKFIHNTIVLNDVAASSFTQARGISINASMTGLTITNNIIVISRSTQGGKHCLYALVAPAASVIDNNDLVMSSATGGVASGVGYFSGNRVTLSDWQNISGFDAASVSLDPQFINASLANFMPANTALQTGLPVTTTGVADDIRGMGRNTTPSPTLGAFEINGIVLPVNSSALSGRLNAAGNASLYWETYSEEDNKGFAILQSTDGKQWQQAGFIASQATGGSSNATIAYRFTDPVAFTGTRYYRLEQTDLDGNTHYSNTVAITAAKGADTPALQLYPNPAADVIYVRQAEAGTTHIVIRDIGGTVVSAAAYQQGNAINISTLLPGMYFVTATGDGQPQQASFIKNR